LLQISDAIAGVRDLNDLIHMLTPAVKQAMDFAFVAVLLHEPDVDLMRPYVIEMPGAGPLARSLPRSATPSGLCMDTQAPQILDVNSETRFPEAVVPFRENGMREVCYLPLTTPVRRLGALAFGSTEPDKFSRNISFLRRVANQVAVAIDNIRHFD